MLLEQLQQIHMTLRSLELHILFLLGVALFGGTVGGRIFQKIKIPQVVGYLIIGFIAGHHVFNIVNLDIITMLQPFNYFALGLIGFMIGGELKKEVFKKYGKQFFAILFSEGFGAFLLVFLGIGAVGTFAFGGNGFFWELGLVLGAIASATAPAATTDVLWEMKSRGPLTTTVLGIIALDDALALLFFAVASSIVAKFMGTSLGNGLFFIITPFYKIIVSVSVGAILGLVLSGILIREQVDRDRILVLSVATVLIVLGLTLMMDVDVLLAAMALGSVLANRVPRISKDIFNIVSGFTPPIYVLFFVLVGAKLNLSHLSPLLMLLVIIYLVSRSAGKMIGANIGARFSGAPKTVQKYLPYCLFSQAGVAIALTMVVSEIFSGQMGNFVVVIIAISTFVVQLVGPPATKFAVVKAGEAGLNITEEDLVRSTRAIDIPGTTPPLIYKNTSLNDILNIFKSTEYMHYPVVDENKTLLGVITLENIRQTLMEAELDRLLLAHDLMESVKDKVSPDTLLAEIREKLTKYNDPYLPVLTKEGVYRGIIEPNSINRFVSTKMLELEQKIESFSG